LILDRDLLAVAATDCKAASAGSEESFVRAANIDHTQVADGLARKVGRGGPGRHPGRQRLAELGPAP
jgi:hypothetical protein